jgi:hypothetical protein
MVERKKEFFLQGRPVRGLLSQPNLDDDVADVGRPTVHKLKKKIDVTSDSSDVDAERTDDEESAELADEESSVEEAGLFPN